MSKEDLTDPIDVLARTIWGEARSEGRRGMAAVAALICNRANAPRWWGRSIIEVCTKPWQFSCWNPEDVNRKKLMGVTTADPHFKVALEVAKIAVTGALPDETNCADHYHTHDVRPPWSVGKRPVAVIGKHHFFRLELKA